MAIPRDDKGLCEKCFHRQDSRKRVERYIQVRLDRGESPPFKGIVNDIAPRAECKRHEGYGHTVETITQCWDFRPQETAA